MGRTNGIQNAGKRFWDAALEKGVTIRDLYENCELSKTCISNFVNADSNISSAALAKLCKYVGVPADYVLGLKENE